MLDLCPLPDQWGDPHTTQINPAGPATPSPVTSTIETHIEGHLATKMSTNDSPTTGQPSSHNDIVSGSTTSLHSTSTPVPESTSPSRRRPSSSSFLPDSSFITPPSPNRLQSGPGDNSLQAQSRRDRHRSAIEFRSGRLSGFFTSFMHRRDPVPSPLSSRYTFRDDVSQHSPPPHLLPPMSSALPHLPLRTVTPPPQLPPPTLQELGLSLSIVTADPSPSHFSTSPCSGTFLEPHYLLLCHAQGLDVLPLVSPPAPQPYALVRRVSFKSVVVMEHRGVLVAIAGRRDGVRVYALEDVKKVIEWRMDFEVRRERERIRREAAKKVSPLSHQTNGKLPGSLERKPKTRLSTPSSRKLDRKASYHAASDPVPPRPSCKKTVPSSTVAPEPSGLPPPYIGPSDSTRSSSDGTTIGGHPGTLVTDGKGDWQECSSDEEAINVVAAGASGSQALDERTSAMHSGSTSVPAVIATETRSFLTPPQSSSLRRNRPANLDLSLLRTDPTATNPPSPTPTLITLRQALSQHSPCAPVESPHADEDDEEEDGGISLVQALLESRLPDLPPIGTRCPQEPILITPSYHEEIVPTSNALDSTQTQNITRSTGRRRRRRWSVLDGMVSNGARSQSPAPSTPPDPPIRGLFRSHSNRSRTTNLVSNTTQSSTPVPSSTTPNDLRSSTPTPATTPLRSKFFTRLFGNAFNPRRTEEDASTNLHHGTDDESARSGITLSLSPPPKLEYVKLPGTKGALLVKAVETAKKSFLAILCGENGEKVELFAGTYRTALGLSRTFILPDFPRSLELQLQGDDLVEIFLVFNQNIFALEPATVRVREVRIGRAERRAARRRARGHRHGDVSHDTDNALHDEDPRINVGVTISNGSNIVTSGDGVPISPLPSPSFEDAGGGEVITTSYLAHEDMGALASAQVGPYTTFQQLSFAPKFPLAAIADDYIIPPTYLDFLQYRAEHEPEVGGNGDLARIQFTPPGLPVPVNIPPCRWFYRDPKGVVHGPWKASLMQTWYKDSLLPPDLPVRKEGETEFILLKDLRLQCVDPTHPFRSSPPPPNPEIMTCMQDPAKPLLKPISLLSQPKHFGPPALFFSSRGGHSTTIVDARGRSVLKGRFLWSEDDDSKGQTIRMGDVKRLEAFNVEDRAVLVAMRQGGLQAMDLGDALLRPADESRTVLPQFWPSQSNTSRRSPFIWRIGTPLSSSTSSTILSSESNGSQVKSHTASSRSPTSKSEPAGDDTYDEILFLGRKDDNIYLCERSAGSFRILQLCPS